jgi:hypothetical protein
VSSLSDHSPLNGPYTMPVAANPPPVLLIPIAGPRSTPPPVRGRRPAAANAAAHSSTVTNLSLCERGGDHRSADRADAITEAADLPSTTSTRMPLLRAKLWQRDGSRQAGRHWMEPDSSVVALARDLAELRGCARTTRACPAQPI